VNRRHFLRAAVAAAMAIPLAPLAQLAPPAEYVLPPYQRSFRPRYVYGRIRIDSRFPYPIGGGAFVRELEREVAALQRDFAAEIRRQLDDEGGREVVPLGWMDLDGEIWAREPDGAVSATYRALVA
jgi:hypothetical protein